MQRDNTIKYVMYLRKSTDSEDRQVQSIADQKREIDKLAQRDNLDVVKVYQENKSAKAPGREQFSQMLDDIQSGKAQGILCWKINRLARNPIDGGTLQWMLQNGVLRSILTPGREYRSGDNVLMMGVELGMANQFILDLSKDVKRGLHTKADKGWRPGKAPLGYKNDKFQEKGNKTILVDDEKFPLVRKLWDLMLTGTYTVPEILDFSRNTLGLQAVYRKQSKPLSLSRLYDIFTDPFYYGEFLYSGETYQGKHTPMVTEQEFDHVQKLLGKRGNPRPKYKQLPLNGIIRCGECGCSITCDEKVKYVKTTKETKSYLYHKCTKRKRDVKCQQKPISHDKLKKQIFEKLDEIEIPQKFLDFALEVLREDSDLEAEQRNIAHKNHQKELDNCLREIKELLKLYISAENKDRELLSESEYKEQKQELLKEKSHLETELKKLHSDVDEWIELTEQTFHFATYAKYWYDNGDYKAKSAILQSLGSNFTLKDQILAIELIKPLQVLSDGLKEVSVQYPTFELANFPYNKAKTATEKAAFTLLSG